MKAIIIELLFLKTVQQAEWIESVNHILAEMTAIVFLCSAAKVIIFFQMPKNIIFFKMLFVPMISAPYPLLHISKKMLHLGGINLVHI